MMPRTPPRSGPAVVAAALAAALLACRGGQLGPGVALQATLGTYQDGSGRIGIAALATVRDPNGIGPATPWAATLSDPGGALATDSYDAPGTGSHAVWVWPEAALRPGVAYDLALTDGRDTLHARMTAPDGAGLAPAAPALSADAGRLEWPAVAGAVAYACRVYAGGALALACDGASAACDVSGLPPGAYAASVLAFSSDPASLGGGETPPLPPRFDVSEARLSFVRPAPGAAPIVLRAAGGAVASGADVRGLALWLSIALPDGTPTSTAWSVAITGPQLPASSPLELTYHANFPRQMAWSYQVPAVRGTYGLTATSGDQSVAATFTVGDPPRLDLPLDIVAAGAPQGSATVDWTPVAGARAYLVDVWDHVAGASAASMWVPAPPATFPHDSFVAGVAYDVYVDATDADMSGASVPLQVSVSEYPYLPGSFVAF